MSKRCLWATLIGVLLGWGRATEVTSSCTRDDAGSHTSLTWKNLPMP